MERQGQMKKCSQICLSNEVNRKTRTNENDPMEKHEQVKMIQCNDKEKRKRSNGKAKTNERKSVKFCLSNAVKRKTRANEKDPVEIHGQV